jgi:serpin B
MLSAAQSSNAFAFDLYRAAPRADDNLVLSPASISTALSMTAGGARGETQRQIASVLHWQLSADRAVAASGELGRRLAQPGQPVTLRIADRLFGEKRYDFDAGYLDRVKDWFGAPLEALDFENDAEASRQRINTWVSERTEQRITELLPAGAVDARTRLVLVDAIYFYGKWLDAFDPSDTGPAPFHTNPNASKTVPTMNRTATYRITASDGVKMLELPYRGNTTSLLVVLPDDPAGLAAIEQSLDAAKLARWIGALGEHDVHVALPKFRVDPSAPLALRDALSKLGMPLAFDAEHADLTGIASPSSPSERLVVSEAFHKAFVKVDESGTEAAAATAMAPAAAGPPAPIPDLIEFIADHPFLFVIRDRATGVILFLGRVQDPARA